MANSNPPFSNASNAAQYAGYAHFYASPGQPQQQQQYAAHPSHSQPIFARPPPPGPPGYHGMRPPMAAPPPPPPGVAPRGPWAATPAPRGPPPHRPHAHQNQSQNQWQWSSGRAESNTNTNTTGVSVVASAPPVMYQSARGAPPPPRTKAPTQAPAPAASASTNSTKWPDSLHDYVKRAFARCKGAADQSITQNALKEMVTNAIMTSTLWTKNWQAEPLPTLVGDLATVAEPNVVNYRGVAPPPPRAFVGMPRPPPPPPHQRAAGALRPPGPPPSPHTFRTPPAMIGGRGMPLPPRGVAPPAAMATQPFMALSKPLTKAQKRKADALAHKKMEDMTKKNQRRDRFLNDHVDHAKYITPTVDLAALRVLTNEGELDLDAMVIKGTCQTIEKEYLRLTSPPHPSTVRPLEILKQALEMVKTKWKRSTCDYIYACSQLKSIRQDCTVQHIKDEFTVLVYETHARVALESGDINEFNQCQTQLHELYEKAIPGQAIEFLSYRILYCVYVSLQAKKQDTTNAGQLGMYHVLASVSPPLRTHDSVRHALDVRQAVTANDYHRFFKLYATAPKMTGYLMDPMVATIRLRALRAICKAYRPDIPIDFVRRELSLKGKEGDLFIKQSGIVFVAGSKKQLVDTKNSEIVWVLSDQSSLI